MRLFEIMLFAGIAGLWLVMILRRRFGGKTRWAVVAACSSLLAVQWMLEGYRWQLAPAYFASGVLMLLIIAGRTTGEPVGKRVRKAGRFLLLFVSGLSLAVSALLAALLPMFRLPEPQGIYAVGTETFELTDHVRLETYTAEPNDHRKVMVTIWYPAVKPADQKPAHFLSPAGTPESAKRFLQAFSDALGLPGFALEYLKDIRGNSYEQAEMADSETPFPIVLISHGMGTTRMLHASQAENLASHGYVVAAIDHTYGTTSTVFPDGQVTGFQAELDGDGFLETGARLGEEWAGDAELLIRNLEQWNQGKESSRYKGMLDLENIGAMGHSFGGATAYHLTATYDFIKAGINMDGTNFDRFDEGHAMTKPFLFMESGAFKSFVQSEPPSGPEGEKLKAVVTNEKALIAGALQQEGRLIYIEGSEHYNFTDLQLYSPLASWAGITGSIKGARGAEIVNAYVLDFFDTYLKGKPSELLNRSPAAYPEVKTDIDSDVLKSSFR